MKRFKGVKGTFILIMLAMLLVSYYFYLSNRKPVIKENNVEVSRVQEVLFHDFGKHYPATPKEVIKVYSELTQCFYNEEYSDAELHSLAGMARGMYDQALIDNQSDEDYLASLKSDISRFKNDKIVVSSYKPGNATDVVYFTKDGRQCASIYCTYTLRKGTSLSSTEELYILRKDDDGHWKILGWELVSGQHAGA